MLIANQEAKRVLGDNDPMHNKVLSKHSEDDGNEMNFYSGGEELSLEDVIEREDEQATLYRVRDTEEIISTRKGSMYFRNQQSLMIVLKNVTSLIRYEKVKLENHFYELLTATVSHEMRTPLNSVTNLLVSLESYMKEDAAGLRLHRIITNSAKMLTYLINDMLDVF